ncbi:Arc family DNA-binding protein [Bartonella apis]|uniref:Arc family DNA-binding protein n=1 Tax=Bartonella apis TaxID=1686310 RepID=UPI003BB544FC
MLKKTTLRLPIDVKDFLERQAKENACSQTSEVVRAVRAAMKEKGVTEAATSSRHVQQPQMIDGDRLNER